MLALLAASEWLFPGWAARFRDTAVAYRVYAANSGVLDTLFSPTGGKLLTVLLILVVIVVCWRVRKVAETQAEFQIMTSLVLTATVVILPMIVPYNHVLLLPSVFVLAREWSTLSSHSRITRALAIGVGVLIVWPWLAATALTLLSAVMPREQVQRAWAVPLFSSLFIPVGVIALQLVRIAIRKTEKLEST
jgi:hypothetical protein